MCIICEYINDITYIGNNIDNTSIIFDSDIDCSNCYVLTYIPDIPVIKSLNVNNCINLQSISSGMNSLAKLSCCNTKIESIPSLVSLQELNISDTNVSSISSDISSLVILNCNNCPYITDFDNINMTNIQKLSCRRCQSITHIPANMPFLQLLDFSGCPSITTMNVYDNLLVLLCSNTNIQSIPLLPSLREITVENCSMLHTMTCPSTLESINVSRCCELSELDKTLCENVKFYINGVERKYEFIQQLINHNCP
jgi:hypothetical protein